MEQYIPKSIVLSEIDRRIQFFMEESGNSNSDIVIALFGLKSFLDTLEVKKVNFKDVKSVFKGQYLSKDKVVTTIERLQDECEEHDDNNGVELLEKLFNKLDILEVKEVDLNEYYHEFLQKEWFGNSHVRTVSEMMAFTAKHFFELGMSLQEEPVNLWHNASEIPDNSEDIVIEHSEYGTTIIPACKMSRVKGAKWARLDDILKL